MVVFYKKWKKHNEIQLTKQQNGLEQLNLLKITHRPRISKGFPLSFYYN